MTFAEAQAFGATVANDRQAVLWIAVACAAWVVFLVAGWDYLKHRKQRERERDTLASLQASAEFYDDVA